MEKELDWNVARLLDHGSLVLRDALPHWDNQRSKTGLEPADARVVEAARVSLAHLPDDVLEALGLDTKDEDRTYEQDEKLINYLMSNSHASPFEQVKLTFVVKLPIFVARQWIRHRTFAFNESSARYSKLPREFYVPALDRMQKQSTSNKQASGELLKEEPAMRCRALIEDASKSAYEDYETLLARGLARELARMVLPTNFYTSWYATVDLRNLFGFLKLRLHSHAQWEIRVYAQAMLEMVERIAPLSVEAFKKYVLEGI